jgi:hypothetical protein
MKVELIRRKPAHARKMPDKIFGATGGDGNRRMPWNPMDPVPEANRSTMAGYMRAWRRKRRAAGLPTHQALTYKPPAPVRKVGRPKSLVVHRIRPKKPSRAVPPKLLPSAPIDWPLEYHEYAENAKLYGYGIEVTRRAPDHDLVVQACRATGCQLVRVRPSKHATPQDTEMDE